MYPRLDSKALSFSLCFHNAQIIGVSYNVSFVLPYVCFHFLLSGRQNTKYIKTEFILYI